MRVRGSNPELTILTKPVDEIAMIARVRSCSAQEFSTTNGCSRRNDAERESAAAKSKLDPQNAATVARGTNNEIRLSDRWSAEYNFMT